MADFWAECLGPAELVGGSVDVPQNKRSRRSKVSQGQHGEVLSFEEPREKSGKRKMAYKLKCLALVFGKACTLCSKKDSDADPVVPSTRRLWGGLQVDNGGRWDRCPRIGCTRSDMLVLHEGVGHVLQGLEDVDRVEDRDRH